MKPRALNEIIGFKTIPNDDFFLEDFTNDDFGLEDLFGKEQEEIFHFKGDVNLDADVFIESSGEYGMYIIDGNLSINGSLLFSVWDSYNILLIKGKLIVENLFLDAEAFLIVKKETHVSGIIVNNLSDGGGFYAHQKLAYQAALKTDSGEINLYDDEILDVYNELTDHNMSFEEVYTAVLKGERIYK